MSTVATTTYLDTQSLLRGVERALNALPLRAVPGFEARPEAERAFNEVRLYAHESLEAAIRDLHTFEDRLCFVIPAGISFANDAAGRQVKSRPTAEFVLLLADRDFGDRAAAAVGSPETPGVIALGDLVIRELIGADLGLPYVCLLPGDGQPFTLGAREQADLPGREVWAQQFSTPVGELRVQRGRPGSHPVPPISAGGYARPSAPAGDDGICIIAD